MGVAGSGQRLATSFCFPNRELNRPRVSFDGPQGTGHGCTAFPVYPESGLFFPPAVCFYEGEIPTDKVAESRDLCKRAISWAGLSGRTDSAPDFSPSAPTATIKAMAAFPPITAQHWQDLRSPATPLREDRGRAVPSFPRALHRPVWCFRSHLGAPSYPTPRYPPAQGAPPALNGLSPCGRLGGGTCLIHLRDPSPKQGALHVASTHPRLVT